MRLSWSSCSCGASAEDRGREREGRRGGEESKAASRQRPGEVRRAQCASGARQRTGGGAAGRVRSRLRRWRAIARGGAARTFAPAGDGRRIRRRGSDKACAAATAAIDWAPAPLPPAPSCSEVGGRVRLFLFSRCVCRRQRERAGGTERGRAATGRERAVGGRDAAGAAEDGRGTRSESVSRAPDSQTGSHSGSQTHQQADTGIATHADSQAVKLLD
jgi:hypothetical protein